MSFAVLAHESEESVFGKEHIAVRSLLLVIDLVKFKSFWIPVFVILFQIPMFDNKRNTQSTNIKLLCDFAPNQSLSMELLPFLFSFLILA